MKVGDMIIPLQRAFNPFHPGRMALLIKSGQELEVIKSRHDKVRYMLIGYGNFAEDWWDILDCDGKIVVWPETQLEVINESR